MARFETTRGSDQTEKVSKSCSVNICFDGTKLNQSTMMNPIHYDKSGFRSQLANEGE